MEIKVGAYYKTRDGSKVRIYATDGSSEYPIHGAILDNGQWLVWEWSDDGASYQPNQKDEDIVGLWEDPENLTIGQHQALMFSTPGYTFIANTCPTPVYIGDMGSGVYSIKLPPGYSIRTRDVFNKANKCPVEHAKEAFTSTTDEEYLDRLSRILAGGDYYETGDSGDETSEWEGLKSRSKEPVCGHEWVTTQGFMRTYTDCKLCGAKQEET